MLDSTSVRIDANIIRMAMCVIRERVDPKDDDDEDDHEWPAILSFVFVFSV